MDLGRRWTDVWGYDARGIPCRQGRSPILLYLVLLASFSHSCAIFFLRCTGGGNKPKPPASEEAVASLPKWVLVAQASDDCTVCQDEMLKVLLGGALFIKRKNFQNFLFFFVAGTGGYRTAVRTRVPR